MWYVANRSVMWWGFIFFLFPRNDHLFVPILTPEDTERRQLPQTHSLSSYTGYHTPIEDELAANSMFIEGEGLSEMPSDNGGLTVGRGSYQTQVCRMNVIRHTISVVVLAVSLLITECIGLKIFFLTIGTFTQFCPDDRVIGCVLGSAAHVVRFTE